MTVLTALTIRPATPADSDLILHFVRELAVYEKAEHEVLATPAHHGQDNPRSALFARIAKAAFTQQRDAMTEPAPR